MLYIKSKDLISYYENIKFAFKNATAVRKHLDVVFVFGGAGDINHRDKFLNFSKANNKTPFLFITIEELYKDLVKYSQLKKGVSAKKIDLANLEIDAIENAYSILIFPESPGSFAELGFFSAEEKTRDKMLVMNHLDFHTDDSYINELIKLIHEEKQIQPFYFGDTGENKTFSQYQDKLMLRYKDFDEYLEDSFETINKDSHMYKLSIIYETLKFFPFLSYSEAHSLTREIFKQESITIPKYEKYLTSMLSLLVVSELIERVQIDGSNFFKIVNDNTNLLEFKKFTEKEQKEILDLHMTVIKEKGIDIWIL